jgi:hypothetical protein
MEAIFALIVAIVGLLAFDFAAAGWGADSRPQMADDHSR